METTIKTVFHSYRFNIENPEQKQAYNDLKEKLSALGLKCFETWGGSSHYKPELDGKTITLETEHLFNNQWNTAPIDGVSDIGLHIFDWAQDYLSRSMGMNPNIKMGHWLEQTPEMREARRNTVACGYCGKQEAAQKGSVFCPHCIDSQYLKSNELHLLRMKPVDAKHDRAPLTEAERAYLLPIYRDAQTKGTTERGKARLVKLRADIEKKYEKVSIDAKIERNGFLWILDAGLGPNVVENCIYYTHTGKFSFGWRTPLDEETKSVILDKISEFPFPYELKCAEGKKLEAV
jgi:hypothetical protein